MVKLFVGNLTERINTDRLKELFAPHCRVTECDVLKNYAFVHIPDDTNVDELIKRLDGSTLDGRAIHIERSTSRLRKQPGMSDKCFRCGSTEHKTTNCPHNEKNTDTANPTIKIDLTNSGKRPYSGAMDGPAAKQPTHGYYAGGPSAPAPAPVAVATPGGIDPEIARPVYGDLQALYDQYAESRQRYLYFKDRLLKEMQSRATGIPTMAAPTIPTQTAMGTQVTAHPVTYLTQQPTSLLQTQPLQQASHPYANAAGLKAPYQMGVAQQQPQVMTQYAVQQSPMPIQQTPTYVSQAQPMYQQQVQQPQYQQQQQSVVYQQVPQQSTAQVAVNGTPGGSSRGYRPGKDQYGWLPDPPKSVWAPQGEMSGETAQRVHLVNAFRRFGYLEAELDPLGLAKTKNMPELAPETYGLKSSASVNEKHSVDDLVDQLRSIYCGPLAIEFMHIANWEERDWLARHFESTISSELRNEERVKLAKTMIRVENFDHFLATKFATVKRYGCEGAEAMFGFFTELFDSAPERGTEQIMLCIAHRGRLNLLTELMQFPTVQMFRKMRGKPEFPADVQGSGDVLSHLTSSFDHTTPDGSVHITMLPNPSHLEAINPVAMGKARARAATLKKGDYSGEKGARSGDGVLCVQVHGDGAFSGQGVVWETLALSQVPQFRTGGSIHLVTNNQVAFTAEGHIGRSTTHCTDIAKAIDCPVIHVNGDNPEEVVAATRLALDYRNKFRKDVFVNMICFRRWGHNELDDPSFTQPLMYKAIESRRSVPTEYTEQLMVEGVITKEEIESEKKAHTDKLLEAFRAIETTSPVANHLAANWAGMAQAPPSIERWDTGVDMDLLRFVGAKSVQIKDGFELHPHLKKTHVETRLAKLTSGEGIDWATAEALAVGSLLAEGIDVRFSGQDVGRGTFCHRHAMLVDQKTDECFIPLNSMHEGQKAFYEVANNLLSEEAILGFEYGYSLDSPRRLCVWEAQFGDFFNGAQIIIDTFIASAESKWLTQSGLTMLLPHGFDGAGPEHSSCRMERFLQLCDSREDQTPVDGENVNMRIANPTTAAQYFHLLRRQVVPNYRKPLIVVGPKILLRHPQAASTLAEFAPGTSFQNVITEKKDGAKIEKVIFVSGKHWIAVDKARKERGLDEKVAIVRVESLSPFPVADLQSTLKLYPNAKSLVWSQEEPRNAGAWSFVSPRFENAVGVKLRFAGRRELAHTATAIGQFHAEENEDVIRQTFE